VLAPIGGRVLRAADPHTVVTGPAVWDHLAGRALDGAGTDGDWLVALLAYDLAGTVERLPPPLPDPGGPPVAWLGRYREVELGEPPARPGAGAPPAAAPGPVTSSLPPEAYRERVERIRELIRRGDCYQVNLVQRLCAPWDGDVDGFARRLWAAAGPASHRARLTLDEGVLVSASPERLVAAAGGRAWSEPIKGTAPPGGAAALARSPKDRAEHVMIVDLVRNDLGRVAVPGGVTVPRLMAPLRTAYADHLVSRVAADLRPGTTAADLLRAVFPGGSVTGCPKVRAMEVIRELEPVGRGPAFGSLVVVAPDGTLEASVLIRTAWLTGAEARYWSGGAVTWDSDPAAEHAEAMAKAAPFLAALA